MAPWQLKRLFDDVSHLSGCPQSRWRHSVDVDLVFRRSLPTFEDGYVGHFFPPPFFFFFCQSLVSSALV